MASEESVCADRNRSISSKNFSIAMADVKVNLAGAKVKGKFVGHVSGGQNRVEVNAENAEFHEGVFLSVEGGGGARLDASGGSVKGNAFFSVYNGPRALPIPPPKRNAPDAAAAAAKKALDEFLAKPIVDDDDLSTTPAPAKQSCLEEPD